MKIPRHPTKSAAKSVQARSDRKSNKANKSHKEATE